MYPNGYTFLTSGGVRMNHIEFVNTAASNKPLTSAQLSMDYFWKKKAIVSFFLSILVVCIHCTAFETYTYTQDVITYKVAAFIDNISRSALCQVAVPLFFVLSGASLFRNYSIKNYPAKVKARIKTLVIPYLIWNIVGMLFFIATSYTFVSKYFMGRQIFEITPVNVFLSIFHYQCNSPFWYVFALICYVAISPLIDRLISKKFLGVITVSALLLLLHFDILLPKWLIYNPNSIVFFVLGCFIGKHYFHLFARKASKTSAILNLGIFLISMILFVLNNYGVFYYSYAEFTFALIIAAISLWFSFDLIIDCIPQKKYHTYSFLIYAIHPNVVAVIVKLIYLFLPKTEFMCIINSILSVIITVAAVIVFITCLKRYFPRIHALVSGER